MTWFGVPILDWVILLVLLGFGVEAYITTRHKEPPRDASAAGPAAPSQGAENAKNRSPRSPQDPSKPADP